MNQIETSNHETQTASTERNAKRAPRKSNGSRVADSAGPAAAERAVPYTAPSSSVSEVLHAATHGKFVLFAIARADQVDKGPVMRGFIEVKAEEGAAPVKVNVAAWLKIGRTSGVEYLSLKVGNNTQDNPDSYSVGPFYGRLFRQVEGSRTRYFGFVEDAQKTGEDENGHGMYERHWQIRVTARPAVSNDQRTRYISGQVMPSQQPAEAVEENALPF